ncbi:hypothetical protein K8375_10290 [Weissella cibaria]|uniref:hypothetical protein n=1 Tax=Weissella cibaria TaxID=137591 RepID=UPI001CC5C935|nr:hypothetical protein [Weissella cibaria]MBZ6070436.1 hypothetical protein [Weissella cibaria]
MVTRIGQMAVALYELVIGKLSTRLTLAHHSLATRHMCGVAVVIAGQSQPASLIVPRLFAGALLIQVSSLVMWGMR